MNIFLSKAYGIDFGNCNCLIFAPLSTFYGADNIPESLRDFISCGLNDEESRITPSRILLENQERYVGIASSRNSAITSFKSRLGLFKENVTTDDKGNKTTELVQPTVTVPYGRNGQDITFTVEQIAGLFLLSVFCIFVFIFF